jgi:hypothetical protein
MCLLNSTGGQFASGGEHKLLRFLWEATRSSTNKTSFSSTTKKIELQLLQDDDEVKRRNINRMNSQLSGLESAIYQHK